jgi:hypothetical protein
MTRRPVLAQMSVVTQDEEKSIVEDNKLSPQPRLSSCNGK